jgi:general L-amino acid transport system substrate-binding protein
MAWMLGAVLATVVACSSSDGAGDGAAGSSASGATLRAIRARGSVRCGISQAAGFATPDDAGRWRGFDVDFCRALR